MSSRAFVFTILIVLYRVYCLAQVSLDHVISLTPYADYEQTLERYREDGFTIKSGHLHENGLLNGHIKFANQTYLELITLTGTITDELTLQYAELLSRNERAVFVALRIQSAEETAERLKAAAIKHNLIENQLWNYITFPASSTINHVFLIEMKTRVKDTTAVLDHKNGASGISEVYMYGDDALQSLFRALGLKKEPDSLQKDNSIRFLTPTGQLILLPERPSGGTSIPRIVFGGINGKVVLVKNFE